MNCDIKSQNVYKEKVTRILKIHKTFKADSKKCFLQFSFRKTNSPYNYELMHFIASQDSSVNRESSFIVITRRKLLKQSLKVMKQNVRERGGGVRERKKKTHSYSNKRETSCYCSVTNEFNTGPFS